MSHSHSHPTADVSVRPGIESDARAIAAIQIAAWRDSYATLLPASALDALDVDQVEAGWHQALTAPPSGKHRMFTACAGPVVVGFAALAPAPDEESTGEIIALEVSPAQRGHGHGSRLLSACADVLKQTNAAAIRTWVMHEDQVRADFLASAGMAPTGIVRSLQVADATVTEEAWAALLD
ncbi:MAG: GNAT family N-acetyltransferase [Beutenbergiaceae bacterium]